MIKNTTPVASSCDLRQKAIAAVKVCRLFKLNRRLETGDIIINSARFHQGEYMEEACCEI